MPHPGSRCTNHCEGEPLPTTERPNCGGRTRRHRAAATLEHKPRMQTSRYPPESVNNATIAPRHPSRRSRAPRTATNAASRHDDCPTVTTCPTNCRHRRPRTPTRQPPCYAPTQENRHPDNQQHDATARSAPRKRAEPTCRNNETKTEAKKRAPPGVPGGAHEAGGDLLSRGAVSSATRA